MPKLKSLVIGSLATVLLASSGAHAGSILGDTFSMEGFLFNPSNGIIPTSGTAGSSILNPLAFDIDAPVIGSPFDQIRARWRDENSFELRLETLLRPGSGDTDAVITLTDLNFAFNGAPVDITGVTFNPNANGYLDFFASPSNPGGAPRPADPIISFTANTITVQYGLDWTDRSSATSRISSSMSRPANSEPPHPNRAPSVWWQGDSWRCSRSGAGWRNAPSERIHTMSIRPLLAVAAALAAVPALAQTTAGKPSATAKPMTLSLDGLRCESCAQKLAKGLMAVKGIEGVKVDASLTSAKVWAIPGASVGKPALKKAVVDAGFVLKKVAAPKS